MVRIEIVELVAAVLVAAIFAWVRFAERHIPHGEARFDEHGTVIKDE